MNKKSVLIIEDDQKLRFLLRDVLNFSGYHTFLAADGYEALDILQTVKPDIIFTDLSMPKVDGVELIKIIKHRFKNDNIPVIAISGAKESLMVDALQAGADMLIKKPFKLSIIRLALDSLQKTKE